MGPVNWVDEGQDLFFGLRGGDEMSNRCLLERLQHGQQIMENASTESSLHLL